MEIAKGYLLEKVCSTDETRGSLMHVHVDVSEAEPVAVACNGFALARVRVEALPDEGGALPVEALKRGRKLAGKAGTAQIRLNGDCAMQDGSSLPRPPAAEYPNWRQIMPREDAPVAFEIALDASLLFDLARALGCNGKVVLRFADDRSPIRVTPLLADSGALGVLMPCRL